MENPIWKVECPIFVWNQSQVCCLSRVGGVGVKKVVNVKAPPESPNSLPCYLIIINLYLYTKSYHFYMVFLGVVSKIILKYSKKLLDYVPMKWSLENI